MHPMRRTELAAVVCLLLLSSSQALVLLANDQTAWVNSSAGQDQGWQVLPTPVEAQALSNAGHLVMFFRRNSDPKKPGHAAVVRPYAQTSLQTLLARGPRVAQASTTNSANADMDLSKKQQYLYAAFRRPAGPAPQPAALEWAAPAAPGARTPPPRYLLDAARGGRWDAFRLTYTDTGSPTWQLGVGGQATAAAAGATAASALSGDWYELALSAHRTGEPFTTAKRGAYSFGLTRGGAALSVADGADAAGRALSPVRPAKPTSLRSLTGFWYAAVEDTAFGLFLTADTSAVTGYFLGWEPATRVPTWQRLDAAWPLRTAAARSMARGWLLACRPDASGKEACAKAGTVRLDFAPSRLAATLTLPGRETPLALQKATNEVAIVL
eukprot:scaffold6.g2808.t1